MKLSKRQLIRLVESVINESSSVYLDKIKMLVDNDEFNSAWSLGTALRDDHPDIYDYLIEKAKYMASRLTWVDNPDPTHYELLMELLPDIDDADPRKSFICSYLAEYTLKKGHIEHIDLAIGLGKRDNTYTGPNAFYGSQIRWSNNKEVEMFKELQDIGYVVEIEDMYDMERFGNYYRINYELMAEPINKAVELYVMSGDYDAASELTERYRNEEGFSGTGEEDPPLIPDVDSYYM